ncbi:MAG: HU family DNA-binding protein [Paludibacter sp.]|nr:HU family DNA-binding protein [Bacteroidales bacterium]MCM1068892.1 HU family DNA-binding protein [Prevotella sp.]MCM1353153.1 HU family DNA-binding protein [Bacteroides sp.]MCM1442475.1 HU family DNA-binding protein [Muribaculum sp.]MCM1481318.1 HU family DNA-binding protein [Paludibacter sp.]
MTTKELIADIAGQTGMSKQQTNTLLNATVETIVEGLLEGKVIRIQNFGDLEVKKKNERVSVHPKTGVRTLTPPKLQIGFKQNNNLKEDINTLPDHD